MPRPLQDPPSHQNVSIRVTAELLAAVDDFKFANRINARADAFRRLLEDGLSLNKIVKGAK